MNTKLPLLVLTRAALFLPLGGLAADLPPAPPKRPLVLMLSRFENSDRDFAAMTLGGMCKEAGVEFDVYYAADHQEGGLFSPHGSSVIGGHHAMRIGRALAQFDTTVVRLDDVKVFDSLIRAGARKVIEAPRDLPSLYETMAAELRLRPATDAVVLETGSIPLPTFFPECVYRRAWALPLKTDFDRLQRAGIKTIWTVAKARVDGTKVAVDLNGPDPVLEVAERWREKATGFDTLEPIVSSYLLPLSIREDRLILSYNAKTKREDGPKRRDQLLKLTTDKPQPHAFGRWYGDPELLPLAQRPIGYNVTEPCRHILTVFARQPVPLPQPEKSWPDLEPSDDQLRAWAKEGKILATWVLHSGELSHDDAVLAFYDWSAMTKMKIGSGVHWQRYFYDPDAVEPLHVPVAEGGVLGLVEPVLHSLGNGIAWETAGEPARIAATMQASRRKIAELAGERFAPRGVYFFGDLHGPPEAQAALWKAVKAAGFEYAISSVQFGDSRILYRDGDFVVLNQAGRKCNGSPFVRGFPDTFAATEKKLAAAGKPGWLVGAIDSPIHGSPIYMGRPYGGKNPQPRLVEYYDYVQKGGATGKVITATPHTVARYARLLEQ